MTLTLREMQVVQGVADCLVDKEISKRLHISDRTVKYYLGQVYTKMGLFGSGSRYKLIRWCFREGISR